MTGRVQTLRSNVAGNRPTGRAPGELYVNWADAQFGSITGGGASQDLVAVRFFSTTATYVVGDFIIQGGQLYRAVAPSAAGAFNSANWAQIGGSVGLGDTPPATPQPGTLWWDSVGGQLYVWYQDANTSQWVIATNTANFPSITVGANPPLAPTAGALWWDSNGAQLYIWYTDGSSSQWVPSVNQLGGNFQPLTGVTDGSDAAAGQIGEVISNVITTVVVLTTGVTSVVGQINLTPGDWDVCGEVWVNVVGASLTFAVASINQAGQGMAAAPILTGARTQVVPAISAGNTQILSLRTCRVSLAAATTYSLFAQSVFSGGGCNTTGVIWARRVR